MLLTFGGGVTPGGVVLSSFVVASDRGNLIGLVINVLWRGVRFRRAGDLVIFTAGELNGDETVCGDERSMNFFLCGDLDLDLVTTVGPP